MHMKKITLFLFGFILASLNVFGQNKLIEPNQLVSFKIKNAGLTVDGTISGLSGSLVFDSKNLSSSSFNVSLNATSVNTGNKTRDGHLQKDEYFDGTKYPTITFRTTKIEQTTSGFVATGNLTMKGISKTIKLPFTYQETGSSGLFKGTITLDRRDYGVGGSSWVMSDDVTIDLNIKVKP